MAVRLRQAVLVAAQLEPVLQSLRDELGLGEPFRDPGVAEFGLRNGVCAIGDTFLEVISPASGETAAGRHLERLGGDGGYMLIFQLDDLEGARERAAAAGVRTVWQIDLADMAGTHLHPADIGGAIVSLDRPVPARAWRWGGPGWTGQAGEGAPGRILGAVVEVPDPDAVGRRWSEILGAPLSDGGLHLDGGWVRFADGHAGLVEIAVDAPGHADGAVAIGGVRFSFPPA
jgi:hypothetical protein